MSKEQSHIDFDLIAKALSAEASAEEVKQVEAWLAQSDENRKEYEAICQLWDASVESDIPDVDVEAGW